MRFEGFARVWTPVAFSHEIRRKPHALKVAGEPVVLFRDGDGKLSALIDRCPHRGVALSLGQVTSSGCLTCPFHGWQFDGAGACVSMPLNDLSAAKRARFRATALAVREVAGLVWLFTGPAEEALEGPVLADTLTSPGWYHRYISEVWNTHWTRAMENMLDNPHVPILHRRTIGRGAAAAAARGGVMHIDIEAQPTGMRLKSRIDGEGFDGAWLEWRRPNGMRLNIPAGKRTMQMQLWCVPVDATHTRMMLVASRNFVRYNPFAFLMDWFNRFVMYEDRAVVESSSPAEVPDPAEEMSVSTDKATLIFRRYYLRHLKRSRIESGVAERAAADAEGKPSTPAVSDPIEAFSA